MVEWLGSVAEADGLRMDEAEEIAEHWQDEPPLAACVRAYLGIRPQEPDEVVEFSIEPREVSAEQWKRICEAEKSYAEKHFRRNPLQ